ncbi:Protein of unknown function DUF1002 [Syntrophomonas zehnderi OL-4]|uniref:DUF1002 domain-containing protein n=1 Tax=Syntrophomonas zehnderi OL-4 TaxID=690567 RepID=A0A0E4GA93_9FIRM|nr:DUF1002 domain-containing protein [Syntrophomonas zehnderi]CFX39973.1 Protein of unknown function DUF1002 [Syntrophomonas zehnderi OL-4]
MKKFISVLIMSCFLLTISPISALAGYGEVVSLGNDLTTSQQNQVLQLFGVDADKAKIIKVTNQEMRQYLEGVATEKQLGTKAISSAYIKPADKGEGISVTTYNIYWVTEEMYKNALVTAGIEDAEVIVAAPFQVSGASALTGIMKAFETATGKKLNESAKKAANEELVVTGELGNEIGSDEAAELINNVKKEVVKQKIKDPEDILELIKRIAQEQGIELTDQQVQRIAELMQKISQLDLKKLSKQLDQINLNLDDIKKAVDENQATTNKILSALNEFFDWIKDKINALF